MGRFLPEKIRNSSEICLEKSIFFLPGSTTSQISNQIDAAGLHLALTYIFTLDTAPDCESYCSSSSLCVPLLLLFLGNLFHHLPSLFSLLSFSCVVYLPAI